MESAAKPKLAGEVRPAMHLGDIRVRFLDGGRLSLDGGAMFGIIPKPLWQRTVRCDERNRISLGTTCLLVETAGRRIIIESGIGSKYDAKDRDIFELSSQCLVDSLGAVGVEQESVDTVILTHLHFDHAGGITSAGADGVVRPTFPRAKVFVQRGEWDDAVSGYCVMTGTYRRENLEPLERDGRLVLLGGDGEIAPGVSVRAVPGHTRHQQGVLIEGGGRALFNPADLIPTAAHIGLRYNMAYDLQPYENMLTKKRVLEEAISGGWTLLLAQDGTWNTWRPTAGAKGVMVERAE